MLHASNAHPSPSGEPGTWSAMGPGSDAAKAAHERLGRAVRTHRASMHTVAVELLAFEEAGHALVLGFRSVAAYAREVHELSPRTVRDLIHLARSLRTLPALDQALEAGELPWTKGRTLAPVLTAENEQAWIDAARGASVRALEAMVANAIPGELPPAPEDCKATERTRIVFELPTVEAQLCRDVIARERARALDPEVTDGELLFSILQRHAFDERPASSERYQVVLEHCPSCRRTAGREAEVEEALVGEAICDATVVDMASPGPQRGSRSRTIPPRVRRLVERAYRGTCAVPGCRHRLWVDLHHVQPFASGGGHEVGNLLPLCTAHHRMLHQGRLGLTQEGGEWVFRFPWAPERRRPVPDVLGEAVGASASASADVAASASASADVASASHSADLASASNSADVASASHSADVAASAASASTSDAPARTEVPHVGQPTHVGKPTHGGQPASQRNPTHVGETTHVGEHASERQPTHVG